jgi:hypothetical protein
VVEIRSGGKGPYVILCDECHAGLAVESPNDVIRHQPDGSHVLVPASPNSEGGDRAN